jgi:hypothetical protein
VGGGEAAGLHAASKGPIAAILLPRRQLLMHSCTACQTVWLVGAQGQSGFSSDEFRAIKALRRRYLAGDLPG